MSGKRLKIVYVYVAILGLIFQSYVTPTHVFIFVSRITGSVLWV